jgi:hypothetical protein
MCRFATLPRIEVSYDPVRFAISAVEDSTAHTFHISSDEDSAFILYKKARVSVPKPQPNETSISYPVLRVSVELEGKSFRQCRFEL